MPEFSQRSQSRLDTCHPILQKVMSVAIQVMDFSILEGQRGEAEQDQAFREGRSHVQFPDSKHNSTPSNAVDIAPYPIDWEDTERFVMLAGVIRAVAYALRVEDKIRWGGDWDRDGQMSDERFRDYVHFEVID